ncbi:MAG: hypothetical protein ACLPV4_22850 [Solirubrobacteraceae bacterium]
MRRSARRSVAGCPRVAPVLFAALAVFTFASTAAAFSATAPNTSGRYAVPATREHLSTNAASPVVHDNEVMALAPHDGRLFAATDQWEYPGPDTYGQVLVKDSARAPWRVFEATQSLRVQALDSFAIPRDQGLGGGHSLLITQAIVNGRSQLLWLLDGSKAFTGSFALATKGADVRSFGAHESGGVWSVYAGVAPTGILRGTWSRTRHTLVWSATPELVAAPPGSPGLKTQKVTGFADCAGAVYVTINTKLYRRNDGVLPPGVARWILVYQEPPVGPFNSGLRGVSCATHAGKPVLLISTEGNGNVYRLGQLPHRRLAKAPRPLVPILEFTPKAAIARMLANEGTHIPASGPESIGYVIAAYNNFETVTIDGAARQLFGMEWKYKTSCPANRTCDPAGYDAVACFAVRTDHRSAPTYELRCLSGPSMTPAKHVSNPVHTGEAFVSIRTIKASPFGDGRIYYGGYDCDFHPADGAAWVASSTQDALRLGVRARPVPPGLQGRG